MRFAHYRNILSRNEVCIHNEQHFFFVWELKRVKLTCKERIGAGCNTSTRMEKVLINLAPPSLPTVPLLHIFFHFLFQILNSPLPQLQHLLNKAIHFLLRDGSSDDFHDIARVRSIETVPMIDDVHLGVYLFL